jgi:peptide methionine sulfoxide reductase MsrA
MENGGVQKPIVTMILPAEKFWQAEEYHQEIFQKTGQKACASESSGPGRFYFIMILRGRSVTIFFTLP